MNSGWQAFKAYSVNRLTKRNSHVLEQLNTVFICFSLALIIEINNSDIG